MRLPNRSLLALLAALSLSTPAFAQRGPGPGPGPGHDGFRLLESDTNADGKLTRAELDAAQKQRFAEIDWNKDGSLVPEELKAHATARREAMKQAKFQEMDTDKDGKLSESELAAGKSDDRKGGKHGRGDRGGPMSHTADANDDGKVTPTEFSARTDDHFSKLDANKDSVLTISEIQAAAPKH